MRWIGLAFICLSFSALTALGQDWRGTSSGELLNPTAAAPAGARGSAKIDGATLALEIQRLKPGQYQIAAVQATNARPLVLGLLNIPDLDSIPSSEAGANNPETPGGHQTETVVCKAQLQLPAGMQFAPTTQFLVMDLGGIVLLRSGLTSQQSPANSFQLPVAR